MTVRKSAANGMEPSDAIRVVNSILTQVDKLRNLPNALVIATTNLQESIDVAFLDRADLKIKVGLPSQRAIYQILKATVEELIRCELIETNLKYFDDCSGILNESSKQLFNIAGLMHGFSGRKLSKQGFLAFTRLGKQKCSLDEFLKSLSRFGKS